MDFLSHVYSKYNSLYHCLAVRATDKDANKPSIMNNSSTFKDAPDCNIWHTDGQIRPSATGLGILNCYNLTQPLVFRSTFSLQNPLSCLFQALHNLLLVILVMTLRQTRNQVDCPLFISWGPRAQGLRGTPRCHNGHVDTPSMGSNSWPAIYEFRVAT